jgi:L-ascorbate metabolism protein UlaG (beta-lactamase superfamily)
MRQEVRQGKGRGGLPNASRVAALRQFVSRAAPALWKEYTRERKRKVAPAPVTPLWRRWSDTGLHAAWLGHSTVLLKVDGFTILTDPIFSERCGIRLGGVFTLGPKRSVAPALSVANLPPIDLILLSHAHFDHFDRPSLRRLENRGTKVVTARGTRDLLRSRRYAGVTELGWEETARIGPFTVRAIEVNHWGARVQTDTWRGYNGYIVEAGRRRLVFAGDTAFTRGFRRVRQLGPVDLAIMPIGAYDPWIHYHCNPEQAWNMADDAGAEFVIPVHHQTFKLSREPVHEPVERLLAAAGAHSDRLATRQIGDEFSLT